MSTEEEELENAHERVMLKAGALVLERDGLAATIRVHEYTIRSVSTQRDEALAKLASLEAERDDARNAAAINERRANGWRFDFAALALALQAAREALEAIEGYDIDWTKGTGENVNAVADVARRALAALGTGTPAAAPPAPLCAPAEEKPMRDSCGYPKKETP